MDLSNFGYVGKNHLTDLSSKWFRDVLAERGIVVEAEREIAGVFSGSVAEIRYQSGDQERFAYVVSGQHDVDSFYEDIYIFSNPVPDNLIAEMIEAAKEAK